MEPAKVLIVDDDENNRIVLSDCLESEGYQLSEAVDGVQALEMIERDPPDVILLDIMMPGMDGMEVLKRLKEQPHTRAIPVIMVTALARDTQISASLDAGAEDHLTKPFATVVVQARVRAALRNRPAPPETPSAGRQGKVIGFIGSKGGVGNTTVAVNVSLALAMEHFLTEGDTSVLSPQRKVSLVELRPNQGTVANHLGLLAAVNLQKLLDLRDPDKINQDAVQRCLIDHASGIRCLLAPPTFDHQATISGQQAERIVKSMAGMSEYVVLDLPYAPCEATRSALQLCDFTVITIGLEESSMAAAKTTSVGLASWGVGGKSLGAVLVTRDPVAESPTYIQKARSDLDCRVISVIPPAGDICFGALRNRQPLLEYKPDSFEASSFIKLADRLVADYVPELQ